jgi:hypothetical protein
VGIDIKQSQITLQKANQAALDLERLLKEQESLISGTKAAASHAKESQVLLALAALPIDRLKDASEESVRIETLRKYGFSNVASIYNSSAIQLERLPGITLESAQLLKSLADQIYQAVDQSISYGIDIDDLEVDEAKKAKREQVKTLRSKLKKFVQAVPVFMYLTDFREEALVHVISSLDTQLFERVTGITLADFHKLSDIGVFHPKHMDEAIWQFRLFERASLNYLGVNEEKDEARVGLWQRSVVTSK